LGAGDTTEPLPRLCGALNTDAVQAVRVYEQRDDGTFDSIT
jgi:uncharacterized protein (DUF952 family)